MKQNIDVWKKRLKEAEEISRKNIDIYKKTYVMSMFDTKYQGKALEILNKWISAKSKAVWVKDHYNPTITEERRQLSTPYQSTFDKKEGATFNGTTTKATVKPLSNGFLGDLTPLAE